MTDWDDTADVAANQRHTALKEGDTPNPHPCVACSMWGHNANCPRCGTPADRPSPVGRWARYVATTPPLYPHVSFTHYFDTDTGGLSFLMAFGLPGNARTRRGGDRRRWRVELRTHQADEIARLIGQRFIQMLDGGPGACSMTIDQWCDALDALGSLRREFTAAVDTAGAWSAAGGPNGWVTQHVV